MMARSLRNSILPNVRPSPIPCQLPKQRRSSARTAARSISLYTSKRMRLCLTNNLLDANVAVRFTVVKASLC
jgi:hypothetical protein